MLLVDNSPIIPKFKKNWAQNTIYIWHSNSQESVALDNKTSDPQSLTGKRVCEVGH